VKVTGDPDLRLWTLRALEREGYSPGADAYARMAVPRVEATRRDGRPEWSLEMGGFRGGFGSVEGLLAALRKNSGTRVNF
jgi:hypothetical protein